MKKPLFAALMIALLSLTLLAGCAAGAVDSSVIPTRTPRAALQPTQPERITAEAAEDIALAHAGISREDLRYLRTEFDYDNAVPEYEIEFYHEGWEYDYEIQAVTGEILKSKAEPPRTPPTAPGADVKPTDAPTQPREEAPAATEAGKLTREEAIAIALADAGLTQDQVTGLRADLDCDDGVPEYEVDFRHGGYAYDYEIHAETGAILARDKDRED